MIVRVGFLVAASIGAAYVVKQLSFKALCFLTNSAENGEPSLQQHQLEKKDDKQQLQYSDYDLKGGEEEKEDEEEVKLIRSVCDKTYSDPIDIKNEYEDLSSREIEHPLQTAKFSNENCEEANVHETETANNAFELERLRNLVKGLEEREVKLKGDLLDYYGLKDQQADIVGLQRQLKIKTVEIDMLNITINSLQAERKKLHEEISHAASVRKELELARKRIKELERQVQLDANQRQRQLLLLKQQVLTLQIKEDETITNDLEIEKKLKSVKELEVEVMELKRKNKELQHEKRELTVKLGVAETKVATLPNTTESEMVADARAEVNNLRHANEDLLKQVEGLQTNRFSEVEELVYLRWVNACLRYELHNYQTPAGKTSARDLNITLSPKSQERVKQLILEFGGSEHGQGETDLESNFSQPASPGSEDSDNRSINSSTSRSSSFSKRTNLVQKLKKWGKSKDESSISHKAKNPLEALMITNTSDGVSISTFGKIERNYPPDSSHDSMNSVASSFQLMSKSVEGDVEDKYPAYIGHKLALEREKEIKGRVEQARAARKPMILSPKLAQIKEKLVVSADLGDQCNITSNMEFADIKKRAPRVAKPAPKPLGGSLVGLTVNINTSSGVPLAQLQPPIGGGPPQPPPPPGSLLKGVASSNKVQRSTELVEFDQSLMKHEVKKDDPSLTLTNSTSSAPDLRSNMTGEIENGSSFLLAVKADVESQGDFVQSLATEVRVSSFTSIDDLVAFVSWLDEELSFLVDERAVLKHFDWPEGKANALREAAFDYQDLVKLEKQVSSFDDDLNLPCEAALKKMYTLLENVEQSIYALLRTRDLAVSKYKEFAIPVDWLLDSGVVGKIKLSSVQLARKYMKRVASELDTLHGNEKELNREFVALQGVRFAFRVHQFAGGFDAKSMKDFEELRSRVQSQGK